MKEKLEIQVEDITTSILTSAISNSKGVRMYSDYECSRLSGQSRGFLYALENSGILNAMNRELIIDYAICLDMESIELPVVEKITLLVLLSQENHIMDNASIMMVVDNFGTKQLLLH